MNLSASFARLDMNSSAGILAVSGGPDSVALAHLCAERRKDRLTIAHVNHQLRGDESDADETFVQNLANNLQLPCKTIRIDVATIAERERANLEGIARRERYAWLTRVACEQGAAWIATGHTADDQAETVLFRLLRGSGILGLGGMPESRPLDDAVRLVRPLLSLRRQSILDYLHLSKITYRIDSSNCDPRFARNQLRLELLPLLKEKYNPAIVEVLCRLADQARDLHAETTSHALRLLAETELPRAGATLVFSVEKLQTTSANLVREMFRLVWQRESWPMGDMDFERWHRLVEIVVGTAKACDFPGGIHVQRIGKVVQVYGPSARV